MSGAARALGIDASLNGCERLLFAHQRFASVAVSPNLSKRSSGVNRAKPSTRAVAARNLFSRIGVEERQLMCRQHNLVRQMQH